MVVLKDKLAPLTALASEVHSALPRLQAIKRPTQVAVAPDVVATLDDVAAIDSLMTTLTAIKAAVDGMLAGVPTPEPTPAPVPTPEPTPAPVPTPEPTPNPVVDPGTVPG